MNVFPKMLSFLFKKIKYKHIQWSLKRSYFYPLFPISTCIDLCKDIYIDIYAAGRPPDKIMDI